MIISELAVFQIKYSQALLKRQI